MNLPLVAECSSIPEPQVPYVNRTLAQLMAQESKTILTATQSAVGHAQQESQQYGTMSSAVPSTTLQARQLLPRPCPLSNSVLEGTRDGHPLETAHVPVTGNKPSVPDN
ncbi:uncharacterized protein LAJ45_10121 [Morchella importuna]|uniref:uncharacterized protein n=1 Tax=Morchella importuna TaxID=1174673 RepID=UPI001E8DE0E2|nr:uncharacterized protein LAJ45_10121 [Morchella importuna]KAH8145798.1 hypothetical protein LAJ45_10121 [Morchella importuna]